MNQTFIDMLVAIRDPVAIEKAYNILAAKRELVARNAATTREFAHTYMEPRPLPKTFGKSLMDNLGVSGTELSDLPAKQQLSYSQVRLEHEYERDQARSNGIVAGDYVEIKGASVQMHRSGFYNGQQFRVIRRNRDQPDTHVIAKSRDTGYFATIHVDYLKRTHPVPTF